MSTGYLYFDARTRPLSVASTNMPNATLTFYLTGTTTPTNVYSNATLTTTLTNPVTADGGGLFPAIYMNPSTTYRVQFHDQNGVLQWDQDPYEGAGTTASALNPSGSVGAPGVTFLNDTTTGLYLPSVGTLAASTGGVEGWQLANTGQMQAYEPNFGVAALANVATYASSSFTGTFTGFTAGSNTGTVPWVRVGNQVTMGIPGFTGTSNSIFFGMAGMPTSIAPTNTSYFTLAFATDNSLAVTSVIMEVDPAGTIEFWKTAAGPGTWTNAGNKGTGNSYQAFTWII